ncbi:MAG: GMC family oxidoreductase [Deltaproteobacteria bacterium]|nr:GMC family oxidoreductase [Deltaproteobacteria bacterium]
MTSAVDISTISQHELSTDVLVIGSGAGGATAARVLAEAGREVVVIEEGRDLTGSALTQRDGPMYDQLYMDRGGRMTSDHGVHVLQARVLGGGPVINAGDVVPITDAVLEHWVHSHGLTTFTSENLEPYRQKALLDLSASRIPEESVNRANLLLRVGAEKIGVHGEVMLHNRVGCAGLGTCLIGCPLGAKQGPRQVSIPAAMNKGARVYTRARAARISDFTRPQKRVVVRALDSLGYRETGEKVIRARTVVVAANAVATPELLLRSGMPNPHIGRGLMLQPQLPIVAIFDEPIDAFRGIPQSFAITEFEQIEAATGLGGFRIEGIMGTPGIVASLLPFIGKRGREMMARYRHLAASLLLVPDSPSGSVRVERERLRIDYAETEDHKARTLKAANVAARAYLAAGAQKVIVPVVPAVEISSERDLKAIESMSLRPASAPFLSAHQQGTVKMAPSPKTGAASVDGLVFGSDRVFVVDSSLFPSSASSHTMAPIITVARMLAERIAALPP